MKSARQTTVSSAHPPEKRRRATRQRSGMLNRLPRGQNRMLAIASSPQNKTQYKVNHHHAVMYGASPKKSECVTPGVDANCNRFVEMFSGRQTNAFTMKNATYAK